MVKYYLKTTNSPKRVISHADYFAIKRLLDRCTCAKTCINFRNKKLGLFGDSYKYSVDGRFAQVSFMIFNDGKR